MIHRRRYRKIYSLKFCDIWQNFYFYRILDNENFKMEVEPQAAQAQCVSLIVNTCSFILRNLKWP